MRWAISRSGWASSPGLAVASSHTAQWRRWGSLFRPAAHFMRLPRRSMRSSPSLWSRCFRRAEVAISLMLSSSFGVGFGSNAVSGVVPPRFLAWSGTGVTTASRAHGRPVCQHLVRQEGTVSRRRARARAKNGDDRSEKRGPAVRTWQYGRFQRPAGGRLVASLLPEQPALVCSRLTAPMHSR